MESLGKLFTISQGSSDPYLARRVRVRQYLGSLVLIRVSVAPHLGVRDEEQLGGREVQVLDWETMLQMVILEVSIISSF